MKEQCAHCGEECREGKISFEDKSFCCDGCKTVYQILQDNDLCQYYGDGETPGNTVRNEAYYDKFDVLNDPETARLFTHFSDGKTQKFTFKVPSIHCSSCIWLLEHLNKINKHIISSEVNFQKKEVLISCDDGLTLKEAAILLSSIGYEPSLNVSENFQQKSNFKLIVKIGVAGFCFGNIMLFAFPEYLGLEDDKFANFFAWLSFGLSIPTLFFAGSDYIKSAVDSIQQRYVNMDIPIALGMITIFARSTYELVNGIGPGYFDSLSGLIFFLLVGKWFQQKTYDTLSFERTYKSYFPLSVNVETSNGKEQRKLEALTVGDIVYIRNEEIIPADGILLSEKAAIDYGFVTGESDPIRGQKNEIIYAGGKNQGTEIKVQLTKKPDSSYLTQLWNKDKQEEKKSVNTVADAVSKYFTFAVLFITLATLIFWWIVDPSKIWTSVTAVLIVACPCALALTIPFTLGNSIRYLGRKSIYLKNTYIIEKLAKISSIAFDKTGTLTKLNAKDVSYHSVDGEGLEKYAAIIKTITSNSTHPISKSISESLVNSHEVEITNFKEIAGKGVEATFLDHQYQIGKITDENYKKGSVGFYINEQLVGYFSLAPSFRKGVDQLNERLKHLGYKQHLISGDTEREDTAISGVLHFDSKQYRVTPPEKRSIVKKFQNNNENILMIGDGLNDAGALLQADVGVAVSDDVNYFVPACDIIMDGGSIQYLDKVLRFSKANMRIIRYGFILSFIYNIVGLSFAITGSLSPIVAAILMPLSSITVVAFTSISSKLIYHQLFDKT
ncbi:heavy metal translocating P-type ATPase [Parvicella tangerina]|uniref:Potassium-transporting ATPase ATP-binding subunit n=1 Tax=Parvicella tangerina TaxID=2829795 RepID=A0A916JKR0_9FLAO|nr:heavy metal translocating P-type ATPase metal-binding domain-containing protein [Parvicella tangerina]CAG5078804.1 Potassium-transporting ATPase ATP-binding subunit [Parvicella tangerina]